MAPRSCPSFYRPLAPLSTSSARPLGFRNEEKAARTRGARSSALLSGKAPSVLPLPATAVLRHQGVSPTQPGRASLASSAVIYRRAPGCALPPRLRIPYVGSQSGPGLPSCPQVLSPPLGRAPARGRKPPGEHTRPVGRRDPRCTRIPLYLRPLICRADACPAIRPDSGPIPDIQTRADPREGERPPVGNRHPSSSPPV